MKIKEKTNDAIQIELQELKKEFEAFKRLYEEEITESKQTEIIQKIQYNIAHAVVTSKNLQDLFNTVRNELSKLIDTTNFLIALYDNHTGVLSAPFEKDENDKISEWPAEKSLTGYLIKQKKSILLTKFEINELAESGIVELIGSRAEIWLGVPMEIDGRILGAIVVQSYDNKNAYNKRSVEILELIANQLSIYIEKKLAEEALRTSVSLLNASLESTADGILIVSIEGKITKWNQKFADMWRLSDEILSTNDDASVIYFILTQLSRPDNFISKVNYLYTNPEKSSFDQIEFLDGRIFERYSQPQRIGIDIVGRVWSFRDITESKQSEEALRNSESRLQSIFRVAPTGIGVVKDRILLEVNSLVCNMTGYSREELVGLNARILYPSKEDFDYVGKEKYRQISEEGAGTVETRWKRKDGNVIDVLLSSTPIDLIDLTKGVIFTALDITERKKVEEKLRESEIKYRDLVNLLPQIVFEMDLQGNLKFVNQRAFEIFEYSVEDFHDGLNAFNMIDEEDRAKAKNNIESLLNGSGSAYYEYSAIKKDGTKFPVNIYSTVLTHNDIPVGFRGIIIDITENKQVERALRESEEKHRILLEESPDPIFSFSPEGQYKFVNRAFAKGVQKPAQDIIGKRIWDVFSKDEADKRFAPLSLVFRTGIEKIIEVRVPRTDGDRFYVTTITPIKDKAGVVVSTVCSSKDITERKRVEEKLRESEERFRLFFEEGTIPMALVNEKFYFEKVNRIFSQTMEYSEDELKNMTFKDITHPEHIERDISNIQKLINKEIDVYQTEKKYVTKNNKIIWGSIQVSIIRDKDGKFINFLIYIDDITKRKKTEEELRESEERYSTIVNGSPNIVFIHKDGIIQFINNVGESLLGYSADEAKGKSVFDFLSEESKPLVTSNLQKRILDEEVQPYEAIVLTKSGVRKHMLVQGSVITYHHEKAYLVVLADITIIKEYERELELAKNRAEESDKLKTAFLQNMSHEIRTPLNGILGFSNLLQDEDISNEEIKEYTSVIRQSGNRLLEIVNNVLDISKIETGQIKIQKKSFPINSLFKDLYNFFAPLAIVKNLSFNYHIDSDDNKFFINTDDSKLNQILINLINNSIKFTQSGSIDFGYEIKDSLILFYVKDTGMGIPEELQEKIFERFIQAEQSITRGYEGAGLGLSICKALVELLGGKIWLESEINRGSTFFFTLPYSITEKIEQNENVKAQTHVKKNQTKILIAEDDYTSYFYITLLLRTEKYIIIQAKDGEQAVEIVRNTPDIDIILMDIRMPVMDGFESTKLIKKIRPDIPIIAQTAYAFIEEKEKILAIGCDDYISKPIGQNKLIELIDKYVK